MGTRAVVLLAVVVARVAAAETGMPNPEAEKLFRDGRALLKDGKIAEACDKFTASSKIEPTVGTLLNVGDCRARLGQTASAWAAFVQARRIAEKTADARGEEADKRSSELEPKLSYLTIDEKVAGVQIERNGVAIDPTVWGQAVPVDPGEYAISAKAPDFDPWSTKITIKPGGDRQTIAVPALHPHPQAKTPQVVYRDTPLLTGKRKLALGIVGGGVLAIGASVVLAFQARSMSDDAHAICPSSQPCHDLGAVQESERAVTRAEIATAVGGVGLAAVATGLVLWFIGGPKDTAVVPTATSTSAGVTVVGRF